MKKKEFKIGETFQCGLVKLKCIEAYDSTCKGCYFEDIFETQCQSFIGNCGMIDRDDKKDVIFKLVKVED